MDNYAYQVDPKDLLNLKRFILEQTDCFEMTPEANAYRVRLFEEMTEAFKQKCRTETNAQKAAEAILLEYNDLRMRMKAEGFQKLNWSGKVYSVLSEEDAARYLENGEDHSRRTALGGGLLAAGICFVPFVIELLMMVDSLISVGSVVLGMGVILSFVAAVGMLVTGGLMLAGKDKTEIASRVSGGRFSLQPEVRKKIRKLRELTKIQSGRNKKLGIASMILSFLPSLLIGIPFGKTGICLGLAISTAVFCLGVYKTVRGCTQLKYLDTILKE